jgi:hypothetical protein
MFTDLTKDSKGKMTTSDLTNLLTSSGVPKSLPPAQPDKNKPTQPSKPDKTPTNPAAKPDKTKPAQPSKPNKTPSKPDESPSKPNKKPEQPDKSPSKPVPKPDKVPAKPDKTPVQPPKPAVIPDKTPPMPDKKLLSRISELEESIKEKNKLIIAMEKDLSNYKSLHASHLKDEARAKNEPSADISSKISLLEKENRELNRKLKEADANVSKNRKLEQVIRDSISTPENGDFILLQKKIEILEQGLYEREKEMKKQAFQSSSYLKHKQEVDALKTQIDQERGYYKGIIDRKNNEISMFRDELDIMLRELEDVKQASLEKERLFMQHKSNLIS